MGAAVQDTLVGVVLPAALAQREPLAADFSFAVTGMGEEMQTLTIPNVTCREPLACSALYPYMLNQINLTKTDDL